jgi:nucleotide-binding universal stress UspA family protein
MRLLLAVDVYDQAEELVEQGAAWAQRLGATLDLIFVDEHASSIDLVRDPAVKALLEREWAQLQQTQRERLERLKQGVSSGVCGELLLRQGRAADELVSAATGYDAVLISTHGRQGLAHMLLGSVAERVVRTSPVPVVVLPRGRGAE